MTQWRIWQSQRSHLGASDRWMCPRSQPSVRVAMFLATRWEDGSSFHVLNLFLQPVHRARFRQWLETHQPVGLWNQWCWSLGAFLGSRNPVSVLRGRARQKFTELDQVGVHSVTSSEMSDRSAKKATSHQVRGSSERSVTPAFLHALQHSIFVMLADAR